MSRQLLKTDEVVELLFDDDFGVSEGDSSDEDGEGVFAYAGQQHFDSAEVAALSKGVVPIPICASTHDSVPDQGDGSGNEEAADLERQEFDFLGKFIK